jgi:hypothetical protein
VTATAFPRQNPGSDRAELTALTLALVSERVSIEVIEHARTRYAEIIWGDARVENATKVVEDFQVKQGPFLGDEAEKLVVETEAAS